MSMPCTRCGGEMNLIKREKLQLGQTGWILGDWPNLIAGALEVEIFCCNQCSCMIQFRSDTFHHKSAPVFLAQTRDHFILK